MSQQKVDKYKEQKAKRKELIQKERRNRKIARVVTILVVIVVIAGIGTGIGFTIRNQYIQAQNAKPDYTSNALVIQDMAGVLEESTAESSEETGAQTDSEQESSAAEETAAEESSAAEENGAAEESSGAEESSAAQ